MFMTHDQLRDLTDLQASAAQIRWLTKHGFKFEVGASGRPKVLVAEVERQMLSGSRRTRELNLTALH